MTQALHAKSSQCSWGSQGQETKDKLGDREKAACEENRT